jgi:hypothetical protein
VLRLRFDATGQESAPGADFLEPLTKPNASPAHSIDVNWPSLWENLYQLAFSDVKSTT